MTHLDPCLVRSHQQDLLAAAHHRRLVRAGATGGTGWKPAQSHLTTGPEKRIP